MSESASTRTKTLTETVDSESINDPLVEDRWTNNITYRQLVISSCIGITQLWWHPYIHDLSRLLPFIFLYNVFSALVGYPMFYLELAIGVVTKKGVINCWDMIPIARGIGFAMLGVCAFSALALCSAAARALALLTHSFHSFTPWLHCAAAAQPACAARHRSLSHGAETPAQSFFFNFILDLKRDGLNGGLGNIVWELSFYYIICWILVYFITIKRIYSYSKIILFKDALTFFVLLCCAVGVVRLDGAGTMFHVADWSVLFEDLQIWRNAIEYAVIQMTISQGSLLMLGSYCPKQQHRLATTSLLAFVMSKTSCMSSALILGATHGALQKDYGNATGILGGSSASFILWADYVARIPGSQFWSALVFFTLFVLALSSVALSVQTIMSALTSHSIRKIRWAFHITLCTLFCFIGIITLCTQGGSYILEPLTLWGVSGSRGPLAALTAALVTVVYGQRMFCEDVFFAVGEYPCAFHRISWALSPLLLLTALLCGVGEGLQPGWVLLILVLSPVFAVFIFYLIFKCRVRNIVRNEK